MQVYLQVFALLIIDNNAMNRSVKDLKNIVSETRGSQFDDEPNLVSKVVMNVIYNIFEFRVIFEI